jgi:branched-chain amino acid transport system substrate-binding protein
MRLFWRAGLLLLLPTGVLSCERGQPRAVIAVVFGAEDVVRVAQEVIAETAREGQPVIVLQVDQRHEMTMEAAFRRAEWALALPDLVAVVGHESSASALTAAPLYQEAGIPFVIPTATTRRLRGLKGVFPLAPDDSLQGAFLARFASQRFGARRPVVFFVNDAYGFGLRYGVVQEFAALGNAVLEEIPIAPESNLAAMVDASFTRSNPDVVIAAARFPETWALAKAVERRKPGLRVIAGDGSYASPIPYDIAGPAADSVYLSVYWHPHVADSAGMVFIQRFRRRTNRAPTPADAMVYDAIMVTVRAIRTVGNNGPAVSRYLQTLGSLSPSFTGVSGTVDFSRDRPDPWLMIRSLDGATHVVSAP